MTVPRLVISAGTMTPNALIEDWGAAGVAVRRRGTASQAPCSQVAHRRCAYSWTSQHTSVARMQVRRTTLDTSVRRGTGWSGSNPGIPTMFAVPVGLGPTHASRAVDIPSRLPYGGLRRGLAAGAKVERYG
jgi:hypothetical protein